MNASPASAAGRGSAQARLPVGIFDSGVGGLTVLAALRARLPFEEYHYLGDTARLPYGTKSAGTVARYALQATEKLVQRRVKLLVVACNTATAAALPLLQQTYAPLPVVGVVEPGAAAACKALEGKHGARIAVIATEGTIRGGAYEAAIKALRPDIEVLGIPCSLFVPLAEEGWMSGRAAEAVAARYLEPLTRPGMKPDCLVLGCTHFPPLVPAIAGVLGNDVLMVDSAATTAAAVEAELGRLGLLRPDPDMSPDTRKDARKDAAKTADGERETNRLHFLTTDAPERFARVGSLFLGAHIDAAALELVSL